MLAIRLQRVGRTGHAQFRLIAQESRFSPKSGRVVAYLGNYNPHNKTAQLDKEAAAKFLADGAQPSPRAAKLLKDEGVKLPSWVAKPTKKKATIRNPEKLRRNRPAGSEAPKPAETETPATEPADTEAKTDEVSAAEPTETTSENTEEVIPPTETPETPTDTEPASEAAEAKTETENAEPVESGEAKTPEPETEKTAGQSTNQ